MTNLNNIEGKIHSNGQTSWDASDATLNYLGAILSPNMSSIETGAGKSTLLFAKLGGQHIVITPSENEVEKIKRLAEKENINLEKVDFKIGFSQDIIPHIIPKNLYDIVFIDGGHGFPIPQIDWQYSAPHIKIGGKLIIDDIDLWTGKILVDFLKNEDGWRLIKILRGRTAIFEKTKEFIAKEWCDQPYVIKKSFWPQIFRKGINGLLILLKFDFATFTKKLNHEAELNRITRDSKKNS